MPPLTTAFIKEATTLISRRAKYDFNLKLAQELSKGCMLAVSAYATNNKKDVKFHEDFTDEDIAEVKSFFEQLFQRKIEEINKELTNKGIEI